MSYSTAGPSRYPLSLGTATQNGSSASFSPSPEGNSPWSASTASEYAHANGAGAEHGSDGAESIASTKRNPLVDLIDSERAYVDQLALVIRRVAAAWSRKDFPPPKLDAMFRCVEAVFRANRGFGTKLKEIGPNPSSPKALGDLLMRWIDDLEPAYSKYTSTFLTGFDTYTPVARNTLLPGILSDISDTTPPSAPLRSWTLDALFLLPYARLRYYRKLYARLLRSTKEGRSDHRLLLVANQRLEGLILQVEGRLEMDVSDEDGDGSVGGGEGKSHSAPGSIGERSRETSWAAEREREIERQSRASSGMGSSRGSQSGFSPFSSRIEDRSSAGSAATSITQSPQRRPTITTAVPQAQSPPHSASMPLSDLELRIDPERTIDLFTMSLKRCKLQMNPSTLSYPRSLRSSHDVSITFTPTSTGQTVVHRRAHIFILTDLFIVAEWMDASDKAAKAQQVAREQPERVGHGGPMPEMWLCYPPLAGKHLMVAEGQQGNELSVMIMRKETFVLHAESEIARDIVVKDLLDCVEFATSMSRRNTAAAIQPLTQAQDSRSPTSMSETRSHESTFPPLRHPSPFSAASSPATSPRPPDPDLRPPNTISGNALVGQMSQISLEPGQTIQWQRPSPSPQQATAPPPSGTGSSVLPPRGASLRPRQASANLPVPQPMMAPPQLPSLPFTQHHSDSAIPHFPPQAQAPLPRSPSGRSVASAPRQYGHEPDVPPLPSIRTLEPGSHHSADAVSMLNHSGPSRSRSADPLRPQISINTSDPLPPPRRPNPDGGLAIQSPSARFSSFPMPEEHNASPPTSPVEEDAATLTGPALISAQMKCKVFLQQSHSSWKAMGAGKLKLYKQKEGNVKQLVVEADSGKGAIMISTIVLTDGVERVAKTGVAVEVSDKGQRTGIIYMIQLRNENSAVGLFESLLQGSDRAIGR